MKKLIGFTVAAVLGLGLLAVPAQAANSRNDIIYGTPRGNTLFGWRGNDVLWGLGGPDVLYGGQGADILLGGKGRDICVVDDRDIYTGCESIIDLSARGSLGHCTEDCEPPPVVVSTGCDGGGQGWGPHDITVNFGDNAGAYTVIVFSTDGCTPIHNNMYRRIARHFIRFGTTSPVADPDVWTVTVLAR